MTGTRPKLDTGTPVDHWLKSTLDLTTDQAGLIVAVLTLVVAVPAIVPPIRSLLKRTAWRALLMSGITTRNYERWFAARHSKIQNIYLNRIEVLDLAETYVSLSFISSDLHQENRVVATSVLADPEATRIMIVGDPGTGKSTLLNAYGAGILQRKSHASRSDLKSIAQSHETPFLVKLRAFAAHADGPASLARYLTNELLQKQAKVKGSEDFLQRLLQRRRCLILLDGLDEVSDDRYDAVLRAITEFTTDSDPSFPTGNARAIISCRRQNFLRIQTDWTPVFCRSPYVLAPLRDADILTFLTKRQEEFTLPRTPEAFFASIKASGTINLHRVPLILTISLGLYLQLAAYEIPRSIGKFYEATINELLIRHDFRGDPSGSTNRYNADDKYRFLREFAFAMAIRPDGFEDFGFADIVGFAKDLIPKMSYVQLRDAEDFVREIIDRSGILTRISDEDEYIFAHRSIQEYLIAVQLIRDAEEGVQFLLRRADISDWRQVILFFGALDHRHVAGFLTGLAARNLELAGQCLAAAGPVPDDVTEDILAPLASSILTGDSVTTSLAALVSAAGSHKASVRDRAVELLSDVLSSILGSPDLVSIVGSDSEGALRLLGALAETDSAQIATAVPALLGAVLIDDERAVAILWRCLAAHGMESEAASTAIVSRLISMAMQERGFEELQRQPAYVPPFMTENLRAKVYPFKNGVDSKSNLVTLLGWAEQLGAEVDQPNRFLEVKHGDARAFESVERDWQRHTLTARPFMAARVICLGGLILATIDAVLFAVTGGGHHGRLLEFSGIWYISVFLYLAPGVISFFLAAALAQSYWVCKSLKLGFPVNSKIFSQQRDENANPIVHRIDHSRSVFGANSFFWDFDTLVMGAAAEIVTLPYAIATISLVTNDSIVTYLIVATLAIWLAFWVPATQLCSRSSVLYLRRPNRHVDMYEDDRSRHWIASAGDA